MNAQGYAQRYNQVQVTSVDPKRLLLLVLDGGLRFLRQARGALAADDLAGFCVALGRAQAIVAELQATLDMERGGEIAVQLNRLYDFMLVRLTDANASRNVRDLDDVLRVFDTVASGFRSIIERPAGVPA
jgi:flagellar secretion chaperone FliS